MYDVLTAALLISLVYIGGKKGFLKTIVIIAGYIIAFVAAGAASSRGSEAVYDKFIKNAVVTGIENAIDSSDVTDTVNEYLRQFNVSIEDSRLKDLIMMSNRDNFAANIKEYIDTKTDMSVSLEDIEFITDKLSSGSAISRYIGDLPPYTGGVLNDMLDMSDNEVMTLLRSIMISEHVAAQYIEENFIRENILSLLRVLLYALTFSLTLTVTRIIAGVFGKANKIPIAGKLNMALGAVLGFFRAALLLLTIAVGLKIAILLTDNTLVAINTETIDSTLLFKYIFSVADKII